MSKKTFGDPLSLERAAAALRELNNSPHAKEALLAQIQSDQAKQAKYQLELKQSEIQKIKTQNHEQRITIDKQKITNKEIAEFNDALDRKKWSDKMRLQEESHDRIRKENEQSLQRQEEIRRETYQFQLKKQYENDEKKIKLQSQLTSEEYRKNFDLHKQQTIAKSQIKTQGKLDIHKLYIKTISDTSDYLMKSKDAAWTLAKYTLFLSGAYFFSKYGIQLSLRQIEARFNQPILVRETSRFSIMNFYQFPQYFVQSQLKSAKQKQNEIFQSMVLNPILAEKLKVISQGLMNKRKSNVPLRNFLFYGPPGTGKTLFAKLAAKKSGLHYAIVSGSDLEKLGPLAASEIDKLFLWAQSSKKGTIIFIDEAESVFYRRESYPNLATTSTLSALLAQTSGGSSKVSLIMASNLPQRLDRAALDRMDSIIEFGFQESEQRKEMILKGLKRICSNHTLGSYLINPSLIFNNRKISHNIRDQFIDGHIVPKLEGLSARQIDKFIYALHDESYNLQSNKDNEVIIDEQIATKVLEETLKQFIIRKSWTEI